MKGNKKQSFLASATILHLNVYHFTCKCVICIILLTLVCLVMSLHTSLSATFLNDSICLFLKYKQKSTSFPFLHIPPLRDFSF